MVLKGSLNSYTFHFFPRGIGLSHAKMCTWFWKSPTDFEWFYDLRISYWFWVILWFWKTILWFWGHNQYHLLSAGYVDWSLKVYVICDFLRWYTPRFFLQYFHCISDVYCRQGNHWPTYVLFMWAQFFILILVPHSSIIYLWIHPLFTCNSLLVGL